MWKTFALQVAGLVCLPVGAFIAWGLGGGIVGLGVSSIYVGLAGER